MQEPLVPHALRVAAALSWRFLAIAAAIAVIALILATLRIIFLPAIVALILATALVPPARWLREHRVPSALAALTVLLGAAFTLATIIAVMAAFVVIDFNEFRGLQASVEDGIDRVTQWIVDSPLGLSESEVDARLADAREQLSANSDQLAGGAFSGALIFVEMVAGAALALVLLFFFVHDGRRMWRWIVGLFPGEYQDDVHAIGLRGWGALTGHLRGTIGVAIFDAGAIALVLIVLGVPFALPLTALIFFGAFIPVVGALVTGFAAVMVALAGEGLAPALIVLGALLLVQQLESSVVAPLLLSRGVQLHPVVVIMAVTAGGVIWGIPGAFVAVPITALVASTSAYLATRGRAPAPLEPVPPDPAIAGVSEHDLGAQSTD
ncbi:MAG: AI-2E family transporter [Chloroflexi bacterium]|nr:AI-2E family transporter [Chloroflexota bacterium]MDA1004256.1 AI-2E family transporter [Chloroflexota bacterium]